jgi:hypothetical protein
MSSGHGLQQDIKLMSKEHLHPKQHFKKSKLV